MVLSCLSLMASDDEHLFMSLLAICIYPEEKCLFKLHKLQYDLAPANVYILIFLFLPHFLRSSTKTSFAVFRTLEPAFASTCDVYSLSYNHSHPFPTFRLQLKCYLREASQCSLVLHRNDHYLEQLHLLAWWSTCLFIMQILGEQGPCSSFHQHLLYSSYSKIYVLNCINT